MKDLTTTGMILIDDYIYHGTPPKIRTSTLNCSDTFHGLIKIHYGCLVNNVDRKFNYFPCNLFNIMVISILLMTYGEMFT